MFSSLFSQQEQKTLVLVDVDSGSVGATLLQKLPNQAPVVAYATRVDVPVGVDVEHPEHLYRALRTLRTRLESGGAAAIGRLQGKRATKTELCFSFGAPWEQTRVTTHVATFEKTTTITSRIIDDIIEEERRKFSLEGEGVFSCAIVHTLLNGYKVTHPVGMRAKRLELTILSTVFPEQVAKNVTAIFEGTLHAETVRTEAFPLVLFDSLRNLFPHEEESVVVAIRGEVTYLLLLKYGTLSAITTMPLGRETLLRMVSGNTPSRSEAEGVFELTRTGLLDKEYNQSFAQRSEKAVDEWKTAFCELLAGMAKDHPLPDTLFIVADKDVRAFFGGLVRSCDISRLRLVERPLSQIVLSESNIEHAFHFSDERSLDLFLATLALFFTKNTETVVPT